MPDFDLDAALTPAEDPDGLGWIAGHEGVDEWDEDDIEQAREEGWGLFTDGRGAVELQAIVGEDDGTTVFEIDADAWVYVWNHRRENYTCAKALRLLRDGCPREFGIIKAYLGA